MPRVGDMFMLGSPNIHQGNVPLAMRLRIDDLNAHLASLDRYGLPDSSSAMADGVRALARSFKGALVLGFKGALRGAFCCGEA